MNYPITRYPTLGPTDPQVLQKSLGSFWNMLFSDKAFIKGYTIAQAEEMIQHYYNLVETIQSYAVNTVPVCHKEKWFPLVIKKSDYNTVPLIFQPHDAVFGPQPETDPYYAGVTFKFGYPKGQNAKVYTFEVPEDFVSFNVLANGVFDPSRLFINNVDVVLDKHVLYFNKDIFALQDINQISLIGDNGEPITFVNSNGVTVEDKMVVLWGYHTEHDNKNLYNNFGYLFDLKLPNDKFYKDILISVVNIFSNGPTVNAIKALSAAFIGVQPVINAQETIQNYYQDKDNFFVITDKTVYKFDKYYTLKPTLSIGSVVEAGDVVVDAIEFYDNVESRRWWTTKIIPKVAALDVNTDIKTIQMTLPPHMFIGNFKHGFTFNNSLELVTADLNGNIKFPIIGDVQEVALFHDYLNQSKVEFAEKLGLNPGSAVALNPLDFIFDNFLKYSTALIKINFKDLDQASLFLSFFKVIKPCLPRHVFFIFYFDFMLDNEEYNNLNNSTTIQIDGSDVVANADGSNNNGFMTMDDSEEKYKTDIHTRLFALAHNVDIGKEPSLGATLDTDITDGLDLQSINLDNQSFGFFFWIKHRHTQDTKRTQNFIQWYGAQKDHLRIFIDDGEVYSFTYATSIVPTNSISPDNRWVFLGAWYNQPNNTLYISVNGVIHNTLFKSSSATFGVQDILMGVDQGRSTDFDIDSFAFYKGNTGIPLNLSSDLYNQGKGYIYPNLPASLKNNLFAWWDMEELTGNRLDSHNNNDLVPFDRDVPSCVGAVFNDLGLVNHGVSCNEIPSYNKMGVKDGTIVSTIPPNSTTKQVNNLLLLDFS